MRRAAPSALVLLVLACLAGTARAQSTAADDEARDLFERGRALLEEGRPVEARELLERSMVLRPHVATAFNLVVARWGSRAPVDASALCERLLGGAFGDLDRERRAQAEEVCASARADVARLVVEVSGAPFIEVRIDGETVGEVGDGAFVRREVDPGAHLVVVGAPEHTGDERRLELSRGETARVRLVVTPLAGARDAESGPGLGLWLGVGLGAAAVVAAIVAIVLVTSSTTGDPVAGDFPVTATLRGW